MYSFKTIRPACIDYENSLEPPDTVYGVGRKDIYYCVNYPECIDPSPVPLQVYVEPKNETSCLISRENQPRLPEGITDELICAGDDRFLVPGACDLKFGSSFSRVYSIGTNTISTLDGEITIKGDLYPGLDGLVQMGRDCGYGEHLVATRLRSHLQWMERVLLPKCGTVNAVQFLDSSRREGDSCNDEHRLPGRCTAVSRCQRKWRKYEVTKEAAFCSSISVICCPHDEIDKEAWGNRHSLLAKCSKLVNGLLPESNYGSMARVLDNSTRYICMGAIISDRTILTSASCTYAKTSLSVQPLGHVEALFSVQMVIPHHSYNSTDYSNDIALLRLTQSMSWSPRLHPACLWTNKTHSPLIVEMLHPFNTSATNIEFTEVLTMYNSDCQRTHAYRLRDSHICVKYPYRKYTCLPSHSMLRWEDFEGVPYLVGLATDTRECTSWYYMTFSRVAAFVDWIVDNVDAEEIERSFRVQ